MLLSPRLPLFLGVALDAVIPVATSTRQWSFSDSFRSFKARLISIDSNATSPSQLTFFFSFIVSSRKASFEKNGRRPRRENKRNMVFKNCIHLCKEKFINHNIKDIWVMWILVYFPSRQWRVRAMRINWFELSS